MNLDLKSLLISIFVAFVPLQITLIGQIFTTTTTKKSLLLYLLHFGSVDHLGSMCFQLPVVGLFFIPVSRFTADRSAGWRMRTKMFIKLNNDSEKQQHVTSVISKSGLNFKKYCCYNRSAISTYFKKEKRKQKKRPAAVPLVSTRGCIPTDSHLRMSNSL